MFVKMFNQSVCHQNNLDNPLNAKQLPVKITLISRGGSF